MPRACGRHQRLGSGGGRIFPTLRLDRDIIGISSTLGKSATVWTDYRNICWPPGYLFLCCPHPIPSPSCTFPPDPFLTTPPMKGKRTRKASSSPTVERVVWQERKTGRGSKITGKVVASPWTPKAKKLSTPRSKRRKLEEISSTTKHSDIGGSPQAGPIPIRLPQANKRGGKVFWLSGSV